MCPHLPHLRCGGLAVPHLLLRPLLPLPLRKEGDLQGIVVLVGIGEGVDHGGRQHLSGIHPGAGELDGNTMAYTLELAMFELVHVALLHLLTLLNQLVEKEEATKAVMADEGEEVELEEARSRGERELDHHIIGMVGGGAGEDEVGSDGDEDIQEEEMGV
ncbi:hypothetical protein BHM03_00027601 [Ensete ventricosum]|nr:hypothetical protein BHM03_00027601 [Ensete ventricosum]